ncbi:MAG: lysophospholipid acyltransferase family protein, partial [Anaerolineales bacterium]|jgi:lauroyl/myristoyl acyltransferase|nr:lysophospholipid acyltransferase family protein [Anaerolineales bacterium]
MALNEFINSKIGPMVGAFLGRVLPRKLAFRLADIVTAKLAADEESALYQAVRSNLAVVKGVPYASPELDGGVGRVLQNAAYGYVDWYRMMASGLADIETVCELDESIIASALEAQRNGHGVVFVGAHISSFNLYLLLLAKRGFPIQVLSYARSEGSHRSDTILRERFGINATPISFESLRQAYHRLSNNGFVITAVDRPDVGGSHLTFFNRKVELPIGHARLAIRSGAHMIVGVVRKVADGMYKVTAPPIIKPEITGNLKKDTIALAQRVAGILEGYIRSDPEDWMMFLPVWPDVIP